MAGFVRVAAVGVVGVVVASAVWAASAVVAPPVRAEELAPSTYRYGACWSAWPITINKMDYGVPGGDQRTNMFSFRMSGGRDLKIKWSVVHGDRRWFAFAERPAFDGTLTLENRGRTQRASYDGDCFPSIEAYHFGTDGSVTELLTSRSKGPFYGLALAPNCKPSNTVELP